MSEKLDGLGNKGVMRILVRLLDGPKFRRQLQKDAMNPDGILGPDAYTSARLYLLAGGFVEKYYGDETPRPRLYLRLTEKGRLVAEHLKTIEELLD